MVDGVLIEMTPEEITEIQAMWAEASQIRPEQVDAERDRRIEAGFSFSAVQFQSRTQDQKRISGAAIMAVAAMMAGAQVGNLRWHGGATDFAWIAADNSIVTMDAQTMFAFGSAAAAHESGHVFAGKSLKGMDPIPQDFTDDAYWP